eukprot:929874-Pyramimonas_sp.AAC.1
MMWTVLASYRCPNVIQAFGSVSRQVVTNQGFLAGCSHAITMMHVLIHRVIVKMRTLCPTVWPRVLMGDSSFQWV